MEKQIGNVVTYELPPMPAPRRNWLLASLILLAVVSVLGSLFLAHIHHGAPAFMAFVLGLGSMLFGANTIAYETPVVGATPPTATQARPHQQLSAIVTGDATATTFTITHNWGLTTAQLNGGTWPEVEYEYLLAAGYTAASLITSKTANTVVFSCTAFTGAGLRVRLKKPYSPTE